MEDKIFLGFLPKLISLTLNPQLPFQDICNDFSEQVAHALSCDAVTILDFHDGFFSVNGSYGLKKTIKTQIFQLETQPRLKSILNHSGSLIFSKREQSPDPLHGFFNCEFLSQVHIEHLCAGCRLYLCGEIQGVMLFDAQIVNKPIRLKKSYLEIISNLASQLCYVNKLKNSQIKHSLLNLNTLELENCFINGEKDLIGPSSSFQRIKEETLLIARTNLNVLISGETGTGKEILAHYIHNFSMQSQKPFIYVNCQTPPNFLETKELFKNLRDGGVLFLHEVGNLPFFEQGQLLNFLQWIDIENHKNTHHFIRIIATTSRELKEKIHENTFRMDLYYRLNIYTVFLPPLRERKNDILYLVNYFIQKAKIQLSIAYEISFTEAAKILLSEYHWPGNIRELENTINSAVLKASFELKKEDKKLTIQQQYLNFAFKLNLCDRILASTDRKKNPDQEINEQTEINYEYFFANKLSLANAVDHIQRGYILRMLERSKGNWSHVARKLDVDKANLLRRARRLQIKK